MPAGLSHCQAVVKLPCGVLFAGPRPLRSAWLQWVSLWGRFYLQAHGAYDDCARRGTEPPGVYVRKHALLRHDERDADRTTPDPPEAQHRRSDRRRGQRLRDEADGVRKDRLATRYVFGGGRAGGVRYPALAAARSRVSPDHAGVLLRSVP